MTAWKELENEVSRIYNDTFSSVSDKNRLTKAELLEYIDKFVNQNGTINKSKLTRILEKTTDLSAKQRNEIVEETEKGIAKTITFTALFLVANVGTINNKAEYDAKEIAEKRWINDMNLRDRTTLLAGELSDELRTSIRQGIYRNEDVTSIRKRVTDVYDGAEWKVDRIVQSEVYNSHRLQFGKTLEDNAVEWVQFNEYFPASKNRERHECYTYAREDNYGLGVGIFHITDQKIYFPHPMCTGYLSVPTNIDELNERGKR